MSTFFLMRALWLFDFAGKQPPQEGPSLLNFRCHEFSADYDQADPKCVLGLTNAG